VGGYGSGQRFNRKATVEESLVVAMPILRGKIHPSSAGTFYWTWTSGRRCSAGYVITGSNEDLTLWLNYRIQDSEDVEIPVRLQTTPTQFSGKRWWFTCPLIVNRVPCQRRVGKLYVPPGARYFGCRHCHRLTYRSCQESHQFERFWAYAQRLLGEMVPKPQSSR
jgi:hypothetical protein